MKILVVCQYYFPEPFRVNDICEEMVKRGHEVTVVTGEPNYPEGQIYKGYENHAHSDEIINGVHVHRCPITPRKTGALPNKISAICRKAQILYWRCALSGILQKCYAWC